MEDQKLLFSGAPPKSYGFWPKVLNICWKFGQNSLKFIGVQWSSSKFNEVLRSSPDFTEVHRSSPEFKKKYTEVQAYFPLVRPSSWSVTYHSDAHCLAAGEQRRQPGCTAHISLLCCALVPGGARSLVRHLWPGRPRLSLWPAAGRCGPVPTPGGSVQRGHQQFCYMTDTGEGLFLMWVCVWAIILEKCLEKV